MQRIEARAPGKVVLMGEYVVLEGAPALSAAVPLYAQASFTPSAGSIDTFVIEAPNLHEQFRCQLTDADSRAAAAAAAPKQLRLAMGALAAVHEASGGSLPGGTLCLDTQAFYRQGHKLGLGSSAAALVAAVRALSKAARPQAHHPLPARGAALAAPAERDPPALPDSLDSLDSILALHRAWQGNRGSGLDVATSALGGVLRYELDLGRRPAPAHHDDEPDQAASTEAVVARPPSGAPRYRALRPTSGPAWAAIALNHPSDTRSALTALDRLKAGQPHRYWQHMEQLAHLSLAACEFWHIGAEAAFLPLVGRFRFVLKGLGEAMEWPIVTPAHEQLAGEVERLGGAYKPSGAGGGDIGVAFFVRSRGLAELQRALIGSPFAIVATG